APAWIIPRPALTYGRSDSRVTLRGTVRRTFPVSDRTLLPDRSWNGSLRKRGEYPKSTSAPRTLLVSQAAEPPMTQAFLSTLPISVSVCCEPNVLPTNGVKMRSACAGRLEAQRQAAARTVARTRAFTSRGEEVQEEFHPRRCLCVTGGEPRRASEPVAVGEHDECQVARRKLDDEAR